MLLAGLKAVKSSLTGLRQVIDHHLVREIDRDGNCIYCSEKIDRSEWRSEFSSRKHYKCVTCSCGKSNCVEVEFIGTGHDNWSGLENKIVKNDNVKVVESTVRVLK